MDGCRLSIIIPTYNCAEYLEQTLQSVLSQLRTDCELIVVDDGSSDGTWDILQSFEQRTGQLRIKRGTHAGVSAARNAGLDLAKTEFAAFMDCDDILKEGFPDSCMSRIKSAADLYIFSFERVDFQKDDCGGITEKITPMTVDDRIYRTASEFADEYIRSRKLLIYSACNKIYRKSILDEYNIRFRTGIAFGEDRLFNYDYLPHCGVIETSSRIMFRYMQRNPESASKRVYPDHFNMVMNLHEAKMKCFLGLSEGTTEAEKEAFVSYDLAAEKERFQKLSE